ncbi:MAG TPA: iron-sulfur cluster repair di-iron protein [Thermoanaerobaculia bacterium]|nr:iron-sulfur cluster repair di-iron protein [Thermoanaerobaculia bacterium]
MNIDIEKTTIGQLALQVPNAIAVLEKWQIDYCCRGHRSVVEACQTAGVPVDKLLSAINDARGSADMAELQRKSLGELQEYIVNTHHAFTRQALETLRLLSEKVAARHGERHPETLEVRTIVSQMSEDLLPHMLKEEQVLFPYVEQLETATANGEEPPMPFFGTVKNPIRMMMAEHDAVGDLLVQARAFTSDYKLPDDACLSFRALYERLAELEEDLHRHIHLENNLLFPRAARLEEGAGTKPAFGAHGGQHTCSCGGH